MEKFQAKRGRVLRIVGELAVIVAGVFLALAADSWRESRADQGREAAYLRFLKADVSSSIAELDSTIWEDSTFRATSTAMRNLLHSTAPPEDPNWRQWLTLRASDAVLATGTVQALVATGDIRLIRSEPLRAAIVALSGALEHDLGSIRVLDQTTCNNLQAQDREREAIAFAAGQTRPIPIANYRNVPALSATFRTHAIVLGNIVFYLRHLRSAFERVQELIEAEDER